MLWELTSSLCCVTVGALCKIAIALNDFRIHNEQILLEHIDLANASGDRGLITVSNHVSTLDDPVGIVSLLPFSYVVNRNKLRWSLGASDLLFTNIFNSTLFALGQVISVVRGGTIFQPALLLAASKLNTGRWVHIFPEGKVSLDGTLQLMRPGVGKIICEAEKLPVVIPIYFDGMSRFKGYYKVFPRINQRVDIYVGQPVGVADILQKFYIIEKVMGKTPVIETIKCREIAKRIGSAIEDLKPANTQ